MVSSASGLLIDSAKCEAAMQAKEEERPASPMDSASHNGGYSSDSSAEPVDVSKLDPATLQTRIKAQVEYYFSQQNLNKDAYMLSQMNAEGFINVSTIASFRRVRNLTSDLDLIVKAVEDSTICELNADRTMLKTSWKRPARTTIILRDVPEEATEADIVTLFEGTSFDVSQIRSDVGQTWFVTLGSEEEAKNAVLHLVGKAIQNQPVKARLKSETLRPVQQPVPAGFPVAGVPPAAQFGQFPYPSGYGMNYGAVPGWTASGVPSGQYPINAQRGATGQRQDQKKFTTGMGKRSGSTGDASQRSGDKKTGTSTGRAQQQFSATGSQKGGSSRRQAGSTTGSQQGSSSGQRKNKKGQQVTKKQVKTPVFKPQDFPSLPMGKISLDDMEGEETGSKTEDEVVDVETPIEESEITESTEAIAPTPAAAAATSAAPVPASSGSWAAAVAKNPPPPPPPQPVAPVAQQSQPSGQQNSKKTSTASSVGKPSPRASRSAKSVSKKPQESRPASESAQNSSSAPQERPKRGWEKPEVATKAVSEVKQIVEDVVGQSIAEGENLAAQSLQSEEPSQVEFAQLSDDAEESGYEDGGIDEDKKGAAWGQKKSFADIIRTANPSDGAAPASGSQTAVPAGSAAQQEKGKGQGSRDRSAPREGSAAFSRTRKDSNGVKVSNLEGNWRKANRPRKPLSGNNSAAQQPAAQRK